MLTSPGIRYFPVDRHTFLALQSFFHLVQQDFGHQSVRYGMCLYQDMLVWTSLPDAADINALYRSRLRPHTLVGLTALPDAANMNAL